MVREGAVECVVKNPENIHDEDIIGAPRINYQSFVW